MGAQQDFPTKKSVLAHMQTRNYRRVANGLQCMQFEKRDMSHREAEWRYIQGKEGWSWVRIY